MNLKTYFRGLGLGIFVTALILSMASGNGKKEMTDDEIRARAAELGMVSENAMLLSQAQALADSAKEKAEARSADKAASSNTAVSTDKAAGGKVSGNAAKPGILSGNVVSSNTTSGSSKKNTSENNTEKTAAKADTSNNTVSDNTSAAKTAAVNMPAANAPLEEKEDIAVGGQTDGSVTITVSSGESSVSVANKLLKAGLITDAKQFDSYLVLSGYDRKLVVGTHTIPAGSTPAEMGQILTTKQ